MDVVAGLERCGGLAGAATLRSLVTRRELSQGLAAGVVLRTGPGRYALPAVDDGLRRAHAVGGVVAGRSAALWWGWEVKSAPARPEVVVPKHRRRPAERLWWSDLHPSEIHDGVVTTQERTLLDCLRRLAFDEALAVADSACRLLRLARQAVRAPQRRPALHRDGGRGLAGAPVRLGGRHARPGLGARGASCRSRTRRADRTGRMSPDRPERGSSGPQFRSGSPEPR